MDIGKLLNPVPNKRPRFVENTLAYDEYWLPTELIALIISFFNFYYRPIFRLVSKKWYIAYEQYFRNKVFSDVLHVGCRGVTRKQLLGAFVKYGHRLNWMGIRTSTLREILDAEPNFASLIPNIIWLYVAIDDGLSSRRWMGGFVVKLSSLRKLVVSEFGFTADEHLADELDKAVAVMLRLESVFMHDVDLDMDVFPGLHLKARASQIQRLVVSVVSIESGLVVSAFAVFKHVSRLGFRGIGSVDVLKEVTEMVIDEVNFPALRILEVCSELDLSHAAPTVNNDGSKVTAMDLYLKICGIRRPKFELCLGFILGACSTTDLVLIEREREFVINLGHTSAEVLARLEITHYTPVGGYDPLTMLFYESAPRYPKLQFLYLHISPTTVTGPRIIEALNNPFLLPHFIHGYFYVDGTQLLEWNANFDPIVPSRGIEVTVIETHHEDKVRMINETNNGVIPSMFLPDDPGNP
ncbi:hypothetical protein GQ42DRAFT_176430 [Ramicandelaber brevisporus]|nr:hypothetical protein GQ42DRAFT_176430 [Ramicandelaber brevisporus]